MRIMAFSHNSLRKVGIVLMLTIKRNTEIKTDVALKKSMSKEAVAGMLFVLPAVIFIGVFLVLPAILAFGYSFQQYNMLKPAQKVFIGLTNYIDVLKNDLELFNEGDNILIKRNEEEQKYYIKECDKKLIIFDLDGYKVGCVIAESYRSEVGNVLSSNHPELDYILIVNFFRNSFSFRTTKDNVDVSLIAKKYEKNGGGHKKAAGMSITAENIWLIEKIINCYKDKSKEDTN